ncbi:MAG: hypothetical protein DCC75_12175 [Proteobacteria bacterium]|nr:MAG: hypothetical protein DCC75_12175 [Pseudomonadota bacterium]
MRGAFGVVFPAAGSASYSLQYAGAVSIASTVTANSQSTACAPIEPRLACVKPQGAGYRARFSYSNQNPFDIIIPAGPNNRFSPAPEFRDQPIRFLSGLGQSQQFEVVSDSTANLTWILANLSAVAKSDSTPCSLPPICNAGGPYKVQQGQNQVILNASQSSDPEGAALTYAWSTTCAGATVTGTLSPLATLMLTANREKCSVTLAVSDGGSVSICNSEITFDEVDACLIDRCGVPCGDGMSCCGCVQVDNSASLLALGNNLGQLELAIKKTTRIVRHLAPKRSKSAKLAKKTSNSLSDLRLAAQSALSAVPGIMTDCTAFFVAGSNFQSALKLTSDTAKQYQVMNNKLLKQAKKDGLGVRKSSKAVIKAALNKISQAIALIPAQDEACTSP